MARQTVKDQIVEQVDRLSDAEQNRLLDFARHLSTPRGVPGRDLLRFSGSIDPSDLGMMSKAILDSCEKTDPNAW